MDIKHARAEQDRARAQLARQAAAFCMGLPVEAVDGATRGAAPTALARQMAMYLTHVAFEMSLARVAQAFCRDRSTVAYACHKIEDMRDDAAFDQCLDDLETSLRAMPSPARPMISRPPEDGVARAGAAW